MSHLRVRCLLATAVLAVTASASAADVTIYRCTDGKGRLALRDTPCLKGERQETRQMLRPTDPPRRSTPKAIATPAPQPAAPAPTRVVVVQAPRPLYECVAADGSRYTSDSGEGNPRWVPLWTLGFPVLHHRDRFDTGGLHAGVGARFDHGRFDARIGAPGGGHGRPPMPRPPPNQPGPPILVPLFPGATWVRDECYPLPAQEVCDRLRDRRYQLDRRYNSALQSERTRITDEQRGIDARLSNDCGANY